MNSLNELTFGDNTFPNILTRFYLGGTTSINGLNLQAPVFPNLLYMDGLNGRVGIGTGNPTHRLELSTDDAAKPGTNTWTVVSDIRMKQNIHPYKDGSFHKMSDNNSSNDDDDDDDDTMNEIQFFKCFFCHYCRLVSVA